MLLVVLLCHVLAAIGVGPIFTLPLLADAPTALHGVLIMLRFGAGLTLASGVALWVMLKPISPGWLYVSFALFVCVVAVIALVIDPAANSVLEKPEMRRRVRWAGVASSGLTIGIAALMVLRPSL